MLIHALTVAQSGFTIVSTSAIIYMLKKNPNNDRRVPPFYIKYWLLSYAMLSLLVGVLIDSHRDLEYFWVLAVYALIGFGLGDFALWSVMKSVLSGNADYVKHKEKI